MDYSYDDTCIDISDIELRLRLNGTSTTANKTFADSAEEDIRELIGIVEELSRDLKQKHECIKDHEQNIQALEGVLEYTEQSLDVPRVTLSKSYSYYDRDKEINRTVEWQEPGSLVACVCFLTFYQYCLSILK